MGKFLFWYTKENEKSCQFALQFVKWFVESKCLRLDVVCNGSLGVVSHTHAYTHSVYTGVCVGVCVHTHTVGYLREDRISSVLYFLYMLGKIHLKILNQKQTFIHKISSHDIIALVKGATPKCGWENN